MHHRHVQGVINNNNGEVQKLPGTVTKQQRKRKRVKRQRSYQQRFIEFLLSCGMIGMIFVLLVTFYQRGISSFFHHDNNNDRNTNKEESYTTKFELYTPNAPNCSDPSILAEENQEISFTLVTQLSEDRLWMMEYHCQRYHHAMSIAVYTNRTHEEVANDLKAFNCPVGDIIELSILDARRVGSPTDYPVNHLRNLAISKVQTSHIIYIDVDFWTSENLHHVLTSSKSIQKSLKENPQLALVIPAFQLFRQCKEWKDCREKNLPQMPYSLHELQEMFKNKRGHIFDPTNKGGHGSTLYQEWMKQDIGTLLSIPCLKSNRYEPFVVVRKCHELPPFQTAFSGYGKNKMTWMMQLIRSGYILSQVGGIFLCHYPHLDSSSRQHWNEAPEKLQMGNNQVRKPKASDGDLNLHEYKRGQVDQLFVKFRNWLQEAVPDQSILQHCDSAQDDDSKLWINRSKDDSKNKNNQEEEES